MRQVSAERLYLFAAWLTHGESIRESPVRPNAITPALRALYKAMVEATRDGSWKREGCDGLMAHVHRAGLTLPMVELVGDFGGLYESLDVLDAPTCARDLEERYQRQRLAAKLLEEAQAIMSGEWMPEEACG